MTKKYNRILPYARFIPCYFFIGNLPSIVPIYLLGIVFTIASDPGERVFSYGLAFRSIFIAEFPGRLFWHIY